MENLGLNAAKQLHALAETGKDITQDPYDLETYEVL
jgi:hypothetical protein